MPSGVTTAMPRWTPDTVPRSTNTTFEFDPAPVAMMVAATVLDGVCSWNTWSALARSDVLSSFLRKTFSIFIRRAGRGGVAARAGRIAKLRCDCLRQYAIRPPADDGTMGRHGSALPTT